MIQKTKECIILLKNMVPDEFQEDGTMFMTIFVPHAIECTSISEIKGLYVNNQAANAEEIREAA